MKDAFPARGEVQAQTADDTRDLGAELGRCLEPGDVVILGGGLGAGKTTFTQGIAEGMKVRGRVTSPTFTIAREHRAFDSNGPTLVHVDMYRLLGTESDESSDNSIDLLDQLEALDLDSELERGVVVAEWGEGVVNRLSHNYLMVTLDRETLVTDDPGSQARIISWQVVQG